MGDKMAEDAPTRPKPTRASTSNQPEKPPLRPSVTSMACNNCRHKKSKCDGIRPICGRCKKTGFECEYSVSREGVTRLQDLQQKLDCKTAECESLTKLLEALQNGTDFAAAGLLARLRREGKPLDIMASFELAGEAGQSREYMTLAEYLKIEPGDLTPIFPLRGGYSSQ